MSLSRLNHWLPRGQTHPEIVQGTAEFHHQITDPVFPEAEAVLHDTAALDTAVDMLDPPPLVERLVRTLLLQRQLLATGLLRRHEDHHLRERERQETQILQEPAPRRPGRGRRVPNGLIMGAAAIGVAQEEDEKQGVDQQDIFDGVVLFLAAITLGLCRRVLGADDASFGAVMGKRGDGGPATGAEGGGASASGTLIAAASASETPSRCARAVRERAGASPRVRSAASSAGKST